MLCKIFIRTFPSTEECELFESILQTRWSVLINDVPGVTFDAYRTKQTPNISTVVWQFPDAESQKKIEKLIDENIKKFTATLSPKTMSFSVEGHYTLKANLTSLGGSFKALSNQAVNMDGQNGKTSNVVLPLYFTACVCWMHAHN